LWACDRCANGESHHEGIVVLSSTTKVERLGVDELPGMTDDEIIVGPSSPDSRLRKMTFGSSR